MNRDQQQNNRSYRNHYADFDEHGNRRTNRMGADRISHGESQRDSHNSNSQTGSYYTRAYGDFSGGTRYGEGGSTYGGGSAYGHSNYGPNRDHGPRNSGRDRNQSNDVRNGYGNFADYSSRNYGSYGGSNDNRGFRENSSGSAGNGYNDRDEGRAGYGDTGRGSTGYDNGFQDYGHTGYGSTGYNNRDEDRERSAYGRSNRGGTNQEERFNHGRDYHPRGRGNDSFSYRNRTDRDR